jgi:hypothetical protein
MDGLQTQLARSRAPIARALVGITLAAALLAVSSAPSPAAGGSVYATAVMQDAPRAYWRLGESSGTAALSETGTGNGTYQGGVLLNQPGALLADPNRAVGLDGTNDTVQVAHSASLVPTSGLTLEIWVKPSRLPNGSNAMTLIRKGSQYHVDLLSNGRVRLGLATSSKEVTTARGTVATGRWVHVVGTWSGSSLAVWVDGTKRAESSISSGPLASGTAPLYLGSSSGTSDRLAGLIDEAAVYGSVLPAARIAAHRNAAIAPPPPPDTTPPAVTLTQPASGASTSDTTPTFAGTGGTAAGDAATLSVAVYAGASASGTPVQTLSAPVSSGSWTVDASPALAPGTYTAQARQSDSSGNVGLTAAVTFTVLAPPTYRATVLADQPGAYWRQGEASGTVAADELGTAPGIYRNGVALGQAGALGGDSDTAAQLDGVNDTVRVPNQPSLGGAAGVSFEAWVKPAQLPADTATIARKESQYMLRLNADGALRLRLWKGGVPNEVATPAGAVPAGAWRHVAFSYDGVTARLFVDGVERASGALAAPVDVSAADLYLGSSLESYDWLEATVDEVAVYDHAVSAARFKAHVDAAARPQGDTLPPLVTLTTPADGSTTTDGTPALAGAAGTASGDSDTVTVSVYAGAAATGTPVQTLTATRTAGAWTRDAGQLAVGTYTARARQLDAAGNVGVSRAVRFTVVAPPTAYKQAVLADSPGAYWRLDEASGSTAVDQIGAHPGTYRNGPALGRPGALAGDTSTSVALDGLDDSIRVGDGGGSGGATGMAVEAWVRPTTMPLSTATIARKDLQYLVRLGSDGSLTFRLWKGGATYDLVSSPAVAPKGDWTHVVATWDGATMSLYADATLVASRALAAPADVVTASLSLGASFDSYDWLAGQLDEVAVYDAALPAARVQAHFDAAGGGADVIAPVLNLLTPAAGSAMDSLPNFGGHAGRVSGDSAGIAVKVYAGATPTGTPVRTVTAQRTSSGTFSVRVETPLPDGTYTAQAEQADAAGNLGRSAPTTFSAAAGDPVILAAGDIAGCDSTGDEATAALLDRLPGTVTTLGEHAYELGSDEEFANCYDPTWGRHKARTAPTVGGHEYLSPNAAPYFSYFGAPAGDPAKGYFSYSLGSWHVVSLNTSCSAVGGCEAGSPMEQWLRQDLLAHPSACTVAMMHEPRFSSGAVHGGSFENEDLFQALYEAGVDVVLSGDDHLYERFAPQSTYGLADPLGVRQFVVGTGGRSHYAFGTIQPNSEARNNDSFGVLKMTLHPGSYDWDFVAEAGRTFADTGSAPCH